MIALTKNQGKSICDETSDLKQRVRKAIIQTEEVRHEKVGIINEAIRLGIYKINSKIIARNLILEIILESRH